MFYKGTYNKHKKVSLEAVVGETDYIPEKVIIIPSSPIDESNV